MKQLLWSLACLLVFAGPASAAKVIWQSIPNRIHVTSDDQAFDASVSFEIGTFTPGFVPSLSNRSQWASKWTVLDRTTYNPDTKFFASTVQFDSNEAPFVAGRRAYIWGSTGGAEPEWVLATSSDWLWPEASISLPTVWNIASASNAITGEINSSGTPFLIRTASSGGAAGTALNPEQWLNEHFEAAELTGDLLTDLDADPDGDGRDNLMEMAVGSDPNVAQVEQEVPYTVDWEEVSGFYYLKLTVNKQSVQQVTYRVEVSGDLKEWSSGLEATATLVDDISTLSVRDLVAFEAGVARFIRLTVER